MKNTSRTKERLAPSEAFTHDLGTPRLGLFDLGGVLYHANYFWLYEEAREALLSSCSIPYADLMKEEMHLPLVESHQSFIRPVFHNVPIYISSWITEMKHSSFLWNYEIAATENSEILHRAWTRLSCVTLSGETLRPIRIPENLRNALARHSPENVSDD